MRKEGAFALSSPAFSLSPCRRPPSHGGLEVMTAQCSRDMRRGGGGEGGGVRGPRRHALWQRLRWGRSHRIMRDKENWKVISGTRRIRSEVQGDYGGRRLRFVDYILKVPLCCLTVMQFLHYLQLPKQNRADSGTTKSKSTLPRIWLPWSSCTSFWKLITLMRSSNVKINTVWTPWQWTWCRVHSAVEARRHPRCLILTVANISDEVIIVRKIF